MGDERFEVEDIEACAAFAVSSIVADRFQKIDCHIIDAVFTTFVAQLQIKLLFKSIVLVAISSRTHQPRVKCRD